MFSLRSQSHSVDQCWWAPKTSSSGSGSQSIRDKCTISQLNPGIIPSPSCPQISSEETSDLFINNNLTISPISHNHHLHQRCGQSLPLAKVKDSVVTSLGSTISHKVSQKITSWRSTSTIPSMTPIHHCLRNGKNLAQLSLIQEQLHQLLLNHLSSHSHPREVRDPHQRQWWEHQDLRWQACHTRHRQDHHSCQLPHCRGRQESNHWSWCNSSQSPSSSSSWKWKVHPSTTSAQSTSSLSSKSSLCVRLGSSRSCSRSSSPLVRPSVHNLRQSVSVQHHCRDRLQNHFRVKENHLRRRESRGSLSASFSSGILSSTISIVVQADSSAGKSMASRLGISRRSKHIGLKYLWIQDEVKEGKLKLKKVGTHFNPSDVLTKYVPAPVLGQHLPHLNIFKVNFKRSAAKQVQYSSHPQPPSSSITPTTLPVFMPFFNNYDHQEALLGSDKLHEVSKEFSYLLIEGAEIKEIQVFIVVIMSFIMIQVQENQGAGVGLSASAQHE